MSITFRSGLALPVFLLTGCGLDQSTVPEIGRNLPTTSWQVASDTFDQRVRERYPVGIEEFDLIRLLVADGFEIFPQSDERWVSYSQDRFPCTYGWSILWNIQNGRVSEIRGRYGASCL